MSKVPPPKCYGASFIPEDCHLQDRGVTWDEVEPYYDQFERIFGVGGKAGNLDGEIQPGGNPHEGPRSREYPNPPTRPSYEGRLFADAVSSLLCAVPGSNRGDDAGFSKSVSRPDARMRAAGSVRAMSARRGPRPIR